MKARAILGGRNGVLHPPVPGCSRPAHSETLLRNTFWLIAISETVFQPHNQFDSRPPRVHKSLKKQKFSSQISLRLQKNPAKCQIPLVHIVPWCENYPLLVQTCSENLIEMNRREPVIRAFRVPEPPLHLYLGADREVLKKSGQKLR